VIIPFHHSTHKTIIFFSGDLSMGNKKTVKIFNVKAYCTVFNRKIMNQGYTNPGRQVALVIKFCTLAPNIWGSSLLHHVNLDIWKICSPLI
jgi:hypothetical protein